MDRRPGRRRAVLDRAARRADVVDAMSARSFWAVEITDPHPVHGGKVVKAPFAYRAHAELWARDEVAAAIEIGFQGVTARVYRVTDGQR